VSVRLSSSLCRCLRNSPLVCALQGLSTDHLCAEIFYDIASGLSVLHTHGVVHGDINVQNILLFHDRQYEEGVQVRTYIAKLSDFGSAMFDTGGPQRRLGGTPLYLAPESGEPLMFSRWKLCDVYSLGILYAVVASGTEDILQLDYLRLLVESNTPADIMQTVRAQSEVDTEGSTFPVNMVALGRDLFFRTLRSNPDDRRLGLLLDSFEKYFEVQPDVQYVCVLN
jgi:serine/threonine protein kinase